MYRRSMIGGSFGVSIFRVFLFHSHDVDDTLEIDAFHFCVVDFTVQIVSMSIIGAWLKILVMCLVKNAKSTF